MKNLCQTNKLGEKDRGMTLSDYYHSIPRFPKADFVKEICQRCDVNENTARNWIFGRSRPQKASYYSILSELTGIDADNLFND